MDLSSIPDIYKAIHSIDKKPKHHLVSNYFEKHKIDPPIIIGGIGGSGTRLVVKLLREIGVQVGKDLNSSEDAEAFIHIYDNYIPAFLNNQDIDLYLFEKDLLNAIELHRQDMYPGKWVWKNPRSIYLIPLFDRLIPNIRFIHVVRNGLDMVCSSNHSQLDNYGKAILNRQVNSLSREIQSLMLWQTVNNSAADYGLCMENRYFLLRYEDVCSNPKEALLPIANALNLSLPERWQVTISHTSSRGRFLDKDITHELTNIGDKSLKRFGYIC